MVVDGAAIGIVWRRGTLVPRRVTGPALRQSLPLPVQASGARRAGSRGASGARRSIGMRLRRSGVMLT